MPHDGPLCRARACQRLLLGVCLPQSDYRLHLEQVGQLSLISFIISVGTPHYKPSPVAVLGQTVLLQSDLFFIRQQGLSGVFVCIMGPAPGPQCKNSTRKLIASVWIHCRCVLLIRMVYFFDFAIPG